MTTIISSFKTGFSKVILVYVGVELDGSLEHVVGGLGRAADSLGSVLLEPEDVLLDPGDLVRRQLVESSQLFLRKPTVLAGFEKSYSTKPGNHE